MLIAIAPSYWQQTLYGIVALAAIVPGLALAVLYLEAVIFGPRAAGRHWPEGAGWAGLLRLPVELLTDLQRSSPPNDRAHADLGDGLMAVRLGIVFMSLAVIPVSTGLVVAQPGLGIVVFPVVVALDAVIGYLTLRLLPLPPDVGQDERRARGESLLAGQIAAACLLGLSAAVVAVQWGSAALPRVVEQQAHTGVFGVAGWGLPTGVVQFPAFVVAVVALRLTFVVAGATFGAGGARGAAGRIARATMVVAGAAWLTVVFLGGGGVPWQVANDGVRHVVSAVVLITKTSVILLVLIWWTVRQSEPTGGAVRRLIVGGAVVAVGSIGVTLALRSLFG